MLRHNEFSLFLFRFRTAKKRPQQGAPVLRPLPSETATITVPMDRTFPSLLKAPSDRPTPTMTEAGPNVLIKPPWACMGCLVGALATMPSPRRRREDVYGGSRLRKVRPRGAGLFFFTLVFPRCRQAQVGTIRQSKLASGYMFWATRQPLTPRPRRTIEPGLPKPNE